MKLRAWCRKFFIVMAILLALFAYSFEIPTKKVAADAVRGTPGDFWADIVLGKRDFGEISPRKVVPTKLFSPGGVVVDRNIGTLGFAYIWDSGNSRIVGLDLETCYETVGGVEGCEATLVIGQPSLTDWGACNRDSSFQNAPTRAPSSAETLCGNAEWTHTTLEDKSFTSMAVDGDGNLYVGDINNHRVLKYNSPTTEDSIADEVWGQANFTENLCNRGGNGYQQVVVNPTAETLCFQSLAGWGAGVAVDESGNLWIADAGNNRVLRYPNEEGTVSKTANLVLGRSNFTTGGNTGGGSALTQLSEPKALQFDASGNLYVADNGNNRVLRFDPDILDDTEPFSNSGTVFLDAADFEDDNPLPLPPYERGCDDAYIQSIQFNSDITELVTLAACGPDILIRTWGLDGNPTALPGTTWNLGGGSLGIDTEDNILVATYVYGNDIVKFVFDTEGSSSTEDYIEERWLFSPPLSYNLTSADRFEQGGWAGVGVFSNGQLVVSDSRLMFWDDPLNAANGQEADGFVGGSSTDLSESFGILAIDDSDRMYIKRNFKDIDVYQGPLTSSSVPIETLSQPFNVLGGGQVNIGTSFDSTFGGIAISPDGNYLWISDVSNHRTMRIRDPLTTPVVDIILGQDDITGNECNRGEVDPPNVDGGVLADLDMLCFPGALEFDNFGNLYLSDHFFEAVGNWRLLMFAADKFENVETLITSLDPEAEATKEFPRRYDIPIGGAVESTNAHATFEVAFDSENTMVYGQNPYVGSRYISYQEDPEEFNALNPADPAYAVPDGLFSDFNGWMYGLTFDDEDNLYAYDTNRGKVLIYMQPLEEIISPILTEVTPVPTPTSDTTPNYTFNSTEAGTISYGGSCSSSTTEAVAGDNTITFNVLGGGTYSNCTITVTDEDEIDSNILAVTTFTVVVPPVLTQVTPVPTPTSDTTPNYTFNSTKAGTISYSGGCTSATTSAVAGNNTITFNTLAPATYSNCKITVTDSFPLQSNELSVSAFTVNNCAFLKTKGDFNCNHTVDLSDLSILASYWLWINTVADANGDNITDLTDLSILSFNWLQSF